MNVFKSTELKLQALTTQFKALPKCTEIIKYSQRKQKTDLNRSEDLTEYTKNYLEKDYLFFKDSLTRYPISSIKVKKVIVDKKPRKVDLNHLLEQDSNKGKEIKLSDVIELHNEKDLGTINEEEIKINKKMFRRIGEKKKTVVEKNKNFELFNELKIETEKRMSISVNPRKLIKYPYFLKINNCSRNVNIHIPMENIDLPSIHSQHHISDSQLISPKIFKNIKIDSNKEKILKVQASEQTSSFSKNRSILRTSFVKDKLNFLYNHYGNHVTVIDKGNFTANKKLENIKLAGEKNIRRILNRITNHKSD
jgi:hypothetical protein